MFYRKTIDQKYTVNSLFYSSSHAKLAQFKIVQGWNQVSPRKSRKVLMRLQKDFQNVLFQIDLQNIKNWVALQVPFMVQHTTLYDSFLLLGYGLTVQAFKLLRLIPHSPRIPTPKTTGPCPHQWGPVDNNLNICTGTKGVYESHFSNNKVSMLLIFTCQCLNKYHIFKQWCFKLTNTFFFFCSWKMRNYVTFKINQYLDSVFSFLNAWSNCFSFVIKLSIIICRRSTSLCVLGLC